MVALAMIFAPYLATATHPPSGSMALINPHRNGVYCGDRIDAYHISTS
jgi:hypothetical protein